MMEVEPPNISCKYHEFLKLNQSDWLGGSVVINGEKREVNLDLFSRTSLTYLSIWNAKLVGSITGSSIKSIAFGQATSRKRGLNFAEIQGLNVLDIYPNIEDDLSECSAKNVTLRRFVSLANPNLSCEISRLAIGYSTCADLSGLKWSGNELNIFRSPSLSSLNGGVSWDNVKLIVVEGSSQEIDFSAIADAGIERIITSGRIDESTLKQICHDRRVKHLLFRENREHLMPFLLDCAEKGLLKKLQNTQWAKHSI